jgi:hypothetical protein
MGYATQKQAEAIFAEMKRTDAEREAAMPDTQAALHRASVARERLRSLGWSDGIYCPKDGTDFALIEWGSTGIHGGHYMGTWPDGHIYCADFLIQPQAIMWKAVEKLSADEASMLIASIADARKFMDRQIAAFSEDR